MSNLTEEQFSITGRGYGENFCFDRKLTILVKDDKDYAKSKLL